MPTVIALVQNSRPTILARAVMKRTRIVGSNRSSSRAARSRNDRITRRTEKETHVPTAVPAARMKKLRYSENRGNSAHRIELPHSERMNQYDNVEATATSR